MARQLIFLIRTLLFEKRTHRISARAAAGYGHYRSIYMTLQVMLTACILGDKMAMELLQTLVVPEPLWHVCHTDFMEKQCP